METEYKILKDFIISNYKKDINFENDFTLALSLGNILYQNIKIKKNIVIDYNSPLCVKKILEENIGQLCGGFQICYFYLLKSFNIKCNKVDMYTNKFFTDKEKSIIKKNYKKWPLCNNEYIKNQLEIQHSHAITEFFYKNKYIIFDPTFNCLYKYKNKYIDHNELREINNNVASDKITFEYFYNENKQLKHNITKEVIEVNFYKNIYIITK
tara:strand:+ start:7438 stop:8070 length:633 start_codon:yes stop_codon:yes gene_type:complete